MKIVPATQAHYDDMSVIFGESFMPKFSYIIKDTTKHVEFIKDLNVINIMNDDKIFVTVKDNEVLGILTLAYQSDNKTIDSELKYWTMIKKYGLINLIRAFILDNITTHNPEKEELYIDSICVSKNHRGSGVGSNLLAFAEEFANNKGFEYLSLRVAYENPRAKQLYERLGFKVKSTLSYRRLRGRTGYTGAYFMVKQLH